MPIKNVKKEIKLRKGKAKGMGYLSWARLEERFRDINELSDQDELATVYVNKEGIHYTTRKARK